MVKFDNNVEYVPSFYNFELSSFKRRYYNDKEIANRISF